MSTTADDTYLALLRDPVDVALWKISNDVSSAFDEYVKRHGNISYSMHWELIIRSCLKHHWDPLEIYKERGLHEDSPFELIREITDRVKKEIS